MPPERIYFARQFACQKSGFDGKPGKFFMREIELAPASGTNAGMTE
jgi:hypothetical protein